jgi:hypothetical protein
MTAAASGRNGAQRGTPDEEGGRQHVSQKGEMTIIVRIAFAKETTTKTNKMAITKREREHQDHHDQREHREQHEDHGQRERRDQREHREEEPQQATMKTISMITLFDIFANTPKIDFSQR